MPSVLMAYQLIFMPDGTRVPASRPMGRTTAGSRATIGLEVNAIEANGDLASRGSGICVLSMSMAECFQVESPTLAFSCASGLDRWEECGYPGMVNRVGYGILGSPI